MRKAFLFLIPAFTLLHSSVETRAAGRALCDTYVISALSSAQEVRDRNCGGEGSLDLNNPRWSQNANDHRRWCLMSSEDSVKEEMAQRHAQLGQCRICDPYATLAAKMGARARSLSCGVGLDHPVWSEQRQGHLSWCMASRAETADAETGHRSNIIELCETCQDYGNLARDQVAEAGRLKCRGISGPRWSASKGDHVLWCMGEISRARGFGTPEPAHTEDETAARDGVLAACKREAKASQGLRKGAAGAAPYTAVPRKKEKAETKPVQAARKPADQPAARQKVPSTGTGSSAMDRLGGGPSGSAGSSGAGSSAKSRSSGSSAAAPAASGSGSGGAGGGGGAAATTINRNAIGGGGSPERIR
jgi:hypothetical protein